MCGSRDGGSRRSTPRGDAELFDFEELNEREAGQAEGDGREEGCQEAMRRSSDGGSSPSTPRGDAELFDFDELNKLETGQVEGDSHEVDCQEAWPAAEGEGPHVQGSLEERLEERPAKQGCHVAGTALPRGEELMSGPRQWEQWFADDCKGKLDSEGKAWESYDDIRIQAEVGLISEGKALEEGVAFRHLMMQHQPEGKLGALMTVTAPEFEAGPSNLGELQLPSWRFFTDAANDVLLKVHRLFSANKELASNSGLELRVAGLEYLLSEANSCHFQLAAEKHYQAIFELVKPQKGGLVSKLQIMFGKTTPSADLPLAWKNVDMQFRAVLKRVKKLFCCVHANATEDAARLQATLAHAGACLSASGPDAWPPWVSAHRHLTATALVVSTGIGRLTRTSPITVCWLLLELRYFFQHEEFQARYQELKQQGAHGNIAHHEMVELTMKVHRMVLPKHGFQGSPRGARDMFGEVDLHADLDGPRECCIGDRIVAHLRMHIQDALGMVKTHVGQFSHDPQFHTVGDSHSMMGWPSKVIRHFQGPLLCYNVGRVDLKDLTPPLQEGDALCWCFGEIDCRNQVHRFCSETRTYQDVIDELIQRYFAHIRSQKAHQPLGVRTYVYNVPPPQYAAVLDKCWTAMPYRGTDQERRSFVLYFNEQLRKECARHGFTFFDVYDEYTDVGGFLKLELSDQSVHVADGVHIREFLSKQRLGRVFQSHFVFGAKGASAGAAVTAA